MKHKIQERDSLHSEAKKLIKAHPEGTTGLIQRYLSIGYSRASNILDILAEEDYISLENGNYQLKNRSNWKDVFITLFLLLLLCGVGYFIFYKPNGSIEIPPEDTIQSSTCTRTEMYSMPPEFQRVLSLILQRQKQNNHYYAGKLEKMMNCVEIRYADLQSEGAEGVFYLDKTISSPEKLVIEVDNNYSFTDDITTAMLLSHELTHARQYLETLSGEKDWGCVDSEVEAYYEQTIFANNLNAEESKSVIARLEKGSQNPQLLQYEDLLDKSWNAIIACGAENGSTKTQEDIACWQTNFVGEIRSMIIESPFYQKQCNL